MNVMDIVQNSVAAVIKIEIVEDAAADVLTIAVTDDGCGMTEEVAKAARSPFSTSAFSCSSKARLFDFSFLGKIIISAGLFNIRLFSTAFLNICLTVKDIFCAVRILSSAICALIICWISCSTSISAL